MNLGILSEMTVDDVKELDPQVVLIPVGSTEPHGSALPYGTDAIYVDAVAREAVIRANERNAGALMYPTLPVGNNVNFREYRFACRIRVRTLMRVLLDIIEALEEDGIRKIVLLNGHGGNTATIHAALREHMERRPKRGSNAFVCIAGQSAKPQDPIPVDIVFPSAHGGESEVSRMMHLRPELVRTDQLGAQPTQNPVVPRLQGAEADFVPPWHLRMPLSAGGDTSQAAAAKGQAVFENSVSGLTDLLCQLSSHPWHPDFPYPPRNGSPL